MTEKTKKPSSLPTGPMAWRLNEQGYLQLREEPGQPISMEEARALLDVVMGPRKER